GNGQAGGLMLYSSGTTGRPKGVFRPSAPGVTPMMTVAVGALLAPAFGARQDGMHLVTGPLYHAAPIGFGSTAFQIGNALVLMQDWAADETLDLIEKHRINNTHMVPTMFRRMLNLPEERKAAFDASSLEGVIHGAAPCPLPVKQAMIEWWGPVLYEY